MGGKKKVHNSMKPGRVLRCILLYLALVFLLLPNENMWAASLEYKLGILGYNKKEISDIISSRKTRRQIDLEYMRKILDLPPLKKHIFPSLSEQRQWRVLKPVKERPEKNNSLMAKAEPFLPIIKYAGKKSGVKESLILAVIKVESDFDPNAISPKGAMGLMQLMPYTASDFGLTNPFDPWENIYNGTRHLSKCIKIFNNIKLALAAYNAGPAVVVKLKKIPPIVETQNYVKKVIKYEKVYDHLIRDL